MAQCGKSPLLCNGTCVGTSSPGTEELLGPLRKERFGEFQALRRPRGRERTLPALRAQLAAGWHPGERAQRRPGTAIHAEDLGWRHKLGRQVTSPNQSGFGNGGHGFRLGQAGRWRHLSQKRGATWERV